MTPIEKPTVIMLGLVHNFDSRLPTARLTRDSFAKAVRVETGHDLIVREVWEQPHLGKASLLRSLRRAFGDAILMEKWRLYLANGGRKAFRLVNCARPLRLLTSAAARSSAQRRTEIEGIVSSKHIQLWTQFVESEAGWLIVFEDDVIWNDDSCKGIQELVQSEDGLVHQDPDERIYFDLAGGFSFDDIGVKHLIWKSAGRRMHFKRPVTNTAAGYLLSRGLAGQLIHYIDSRPLAKQVGVDFLLNQFFMYLSQKRLAVNCIHFLPPIVLHGSFTGHHSSWELDVFGRKGEV